MTGTKKSIAPILILIACLAMLNSTAQVRNAKPEQYRVVNLTMKQGLPVGVYNSMIKDVFGFLWVGGPGLFRFDGTNMKRYVPDKNRPGAINTDDVFSFVEDSLNNIWMGTRNGLSRYDINGDTFTNFASGVDSSTVQNHVMAGGVVPFWTTSTHVYCFEVLSQHIVTYDIRSFEKTILYEPGESDKLKIDGISIHSIILDTRSKSIWMFHHDASNPGILQISLNDSKKQVYTWPCLGNDTGHRHNAEAMVMDPKRNSIWINSGDGLVEFSLVNKQFRHIDAFDELRTLKDYDRLVGIDMDQKGNILMATQPNGILVYEPVTNVLKPVLSDPEQQQRVGQNNLSIYCDRDGLIWISDYMGAGIFELLPISPSVKRYAGNPNIRDSLSNGRIYNIVQGTQGKVWLGTADGLNIFDPRTEKFEVLREKDLQGLKGVAVIPVHVDTLQQKAWLIAGSSNARAHFEMDMYEMDLKTRKCMPIIFRKGSTQLDTTTIEAILVKPYKNGLMVYDEKLPGLFEVIPGKQFADVLIPLKTHTMVGEVEIEEDRFIFLRSYEALPNLSYEMKNGTWTKIPHMLDSFPWQSLVFNENDKTHWISFENELVHYDKDFRRIRAYAWGDENIEMILDMVLDVKGNPWFINDIGRVGRLDVATHVISYLSAADGYQYKDFDWSTPMLKDARGNLYLGTGYTKGSEGLDVVNVNLYTPAHAPSIYLRSLAINQKPYDHSVALNRLTELSLAHDQNSFVLETGIIDHYSTGTGRLRHRLEKNGKAEDWLSGSTYHTIRYDDLAPGLYQLVIQASDAGSNFSTERTITITVNSPFWETWWFRTLVVLTVIFGTYTIIQLRSRSLRERNAELEGRVIVRTKELRHSLEELRATQAQLIQSEKMASLGELTAGIAHEIQNPLNFVNNFSDLNKELFAEMNEEIEKGNLDEVKAIAKDIADNEAKINHHGKRADAIVKGMLQHSRVRDGKKELTDINRLADEYLRLAYHGLRAKDKSFNASIKTDFDESVKSIEIIPQDIGRVVLNLITNAFYAVTEKRKVQFNHQMAGQSVYEPTVWISTTKTSNTLELRVKDNGNGIPKNVIDKIFQPFFTTKPTGQGTGLGLSLSYDIIKAHGGELLVETTEGEGATFIMKLPAT